jgi:aspartate 1-decarboxylase
MKEYLSSKIHNITVTDSNIEYEGSIEIAEDIMKKAKIEEYQKVLVASITSGARFETYVIKGPLGSGVISINGAAAHLVKKGEKVIIMSFELAHKASSPTIILGSEVEN